MEDADHTFEPAGNGGSPGGEALPVPVFSINATAARPDTAIAGLMDFGGPVEEPLTVRQIFLMSVAESVPRGYMVDDEEGTILLISDRREPVPVCAALLVVRLERGRNGAESLMVIAFLNDKDEVVEVAIPAGDIGGSSPAGVRILRNAGVRIHARDGVLADLLRGFPYAVVEPTRVKPGWISAQPRVFGLPDQHYAVSNNDAGAVTLAAGRYVPDDQKVDEWKVKVGGNLVGNDYALFLLCTALSGPILDLLSWRGGIFNFAFPTSSAKTTALTIANNAWRGDAPHGWTMTRAALDDACIAADGTFLALDEVPAQGLPKVEATVFSVCNGVRRGARPAPGQQIEDRGWNTAGASTSEFPLWELAQADAGKSRVSGGAGGKPLRMKEGTFVRLVDVGGREEIMWQDLHGERSKGHFLRSVERSSAALAGTIGPAFVDRLLNNHDLFTRDLPTWHGKWTERIARDLGIDPDEDDGAHMRVAGNFAAVWLAGDRAASMGIVPCSRDEIAKAVRTAAHSWAKIRKIGKYEVKEDPVALIRDFVLPRLGKEFREVGPDRKPLGKMAYAQAGWFNEQSYFLRPATVRALVQAKAKRDKDMKGLVQDVCNALEEKGALVRGGAKDCMMVRMADCIESGSRVYMLRREVIDDMGEEA